MSEPENPRLFTMDGASGLGGLPQGAPYWSTKVTLRDLFAGMAMQGMLANMTGDLDWGRWGDTMHKFAFKAYLTADAMLAAREGK